MTYSAPVVGAISVYQTALAARAAGISFLPIRTDGSKRPALRSWGAYQHRLPTHEEARCWFSQSDYGIGFVAGAVSGGVEVLDFDSLQAYFAFVHQMSVSGAASLLASLTSGYCEKTPHGIHLYYRSTVIEGSQKLAQRLTSDGERSEVETRGEGGYSIGAPSGGNVHPSRLPYRVLHGELARIPTISGEDRRRLLAIARTLDLMPVLARSTQIQRGPMRLLSRHTEPLPGTLFNVRGPSWAHLLEPFGWVWVKAVGEEAFWRRPGKSRGVSASTNFQGTDCLYVFSTSTTLPARVGMKKFTVYALLNHQGDFSQAASALARLGYGRTNDSIETHEKGHRS